MNDDEMVTLEVQMTEDDVRTIAKHGVENEWPFTDAARRWVEAHDRPERRVLALDEYPERDFWHRAVAVEDLQPGDRMAGREVAVHPTRWNTLVTIHWSDGGDHTNYGPGTLVVLSGDQ